MATEVPFFSCHFQRGGNPREQAGGPGNLLVTLQPPRLKPTFSLYSLADDPATKYNDASRYNGVRCQNANSRKGNKSVRPTTAVS